jgi:hypothetical protein
MISLGVFAQTDGLQKKNLEPFNKLIVSGDVTVYLKQSTENYISATQENFSMMSQQVSDNSLLISGGVDQVYVGVQNINEIILNGTSDVYATDTLRGETLKVLLSGAANGNILFVGKSADVSLSGTSDLKLAGNAGNIEARVTGAGDLQAGRFNVMDANVLISGTGDAKVAASNKISGAVSGAGTLYHIGTPKEITATVSGTGEIKKANSIAIDGSDTTRISLGNKEIIILEKELENAANEIGDDIKNSFKDGDDDKKKKKKDKPNSIWSGFELGINGWLNSDNSLNMDSVNSNFGLNYGKSIAVNFNLWEVNAKIIKNYVFVTTGLGSEINNYRFDKNIRMVGNSNPLVLQVEDSVKYIKSKFTIGYLNAPLYLTFATKPIKKGKRLFISPGVTGGWRFTSYNKRKVEVDGDESKSRNKDDFNLNPFRVNASLRIGYGDFVLFANYALTDLFQRGKGPDITPFSVGVRVVGFGG